MVTVMAASPQHLKADSPTAWLSLASNGQLVEDGSSLVTPAIRRAAVEEFSLNYEGFDPDQEGLREVLTSTGNGHFCSRGAAEWEDADGVHYPGTYAHGVYNRETTILGGVPVLNEDLVNLPNWLVLRLRIEGEDAIRLADVELLDYRHELDLRRALMTRSVRFRDQARARDDAAQPAIREHGRIRTAPRSNGR